MTRRRATLAQVARDLAGPPPPTMDVVAPARTVGLELVSGRGHYERVIGAIRRAHTSVWIATANVKELLVENRRRYVSILAILDELAERGVELRLLHAELPSRPFREHIADYPRLVNGALALRRCPRVHLKTVIVDGALLYLGSANWTGAGLGAKGSGRRNLSSASSRTTRPCSTRSRRCTSTCGRVASAPGAGCTPSVRDRWRTCDLRYFADLRTAM